MAFPHVEDGTFDQLGHQKQIMSFIQLDFFSKLMFILLNQEVMWDLLMASSNI